MAVAVTQPSRRPGSIAALTATLTESGIPLGKRATLHADVVAPDTTSSTQPLAEIDNGVYRGSVETPTSGVYRMLVRAEGWSLRDERFTRQELRTLAVWSRGDDRPVPPHDRHGSDLCGLVTCLLDDEGLMKLAREKGIDVQALRRCVEVHCREREGG